LGDEHTIDVRVVACEEGKSSLEPARETSAVCPFPEWFPNHRNEVLPTLCDQMKETGADSISIEGDSYGVPLVVGGGLVDVRAVEDKEPGQGCLPSMLESKTCADNLRSQTIKGNLAHLAVVIFIRRYVLMNGD